MLFYITLFFIYIYKRNFKTFRITKEAKEEFPTRNHDIPLMLCLAEQGKERKIIHFFHCVVFSPFRSSKK